MPSATGAESSHGASATGSSPVTLARIYREQQSTASRILHYANCSLHTWHVHVSAMLPSRSFLHQCPIKFTMLTRRGAGLVASLKPSTPLPLPGFAPASHHAARLQRSSTATHVLQGQFNQSLNHSGRSRRLTALLPTSRHRPLPPCLRALSLSRTIATAAPPTRRSRATRFLLRALTGFGFVGLSVTAFVVGFFIYDASTYRNTTEETVVVPELALHPRRGGPKNLPIAEALLDEVDDRERAADNDKPRLVILGGGWGVSRRVLLVRWSGTMSLC